MPSETVCQHLFITGHVQGVGYRAALESTARGLNLSGWVRNLHDGRVEALVQGPAPAVARLVQWCHRGPPMERVDAVQARDHAIDAALAPMHCIATA